MGRVGRAALEGVRAFGMAMDGGDRPAYALSVTEAAESLASRVLTSRALVEACLARIDERDEDLRAWVYVARDAALAAADASDARRASGRAASAIDGVPLGVKDIIATGDQPTSMGSPLFSGHHPEQDAAVVGRLRAAGAVVLGKTVTTELAYLHPAATRNPWDFECTPGGSSCGSTAAVAIGMVPAALGSQTGGSVVRPAAFCGTVGFKPSKDCLPIAGVLNTSPTLDTVGVITRTVDDAALLLGAISAPPQTIAPRIEPPSAPPRLAVLESLPWVHADSAQLAAMGACYDLLRADGAVLEVVELPPAWREANVVHRRIMLYEIARAMLPRFETLRGELSEEMNSALDEGMEVTAEQYVEARARRESIIGGLAAWLGSCAAVISPPVPGAAPRDLTHTGNPAFCSFWTLTGAPAMNLPVAVSAAGLPMGIQLSAIPGRDNALLSVARWIEQRVRFTGLV